jgi:hypothetical protein
MVSTRRLVVVLQLGIVWILADHDEEALAEDQQHKHPPIPSSNAKKLVVCTTIENGWNIWKDRPNPTETTNHIVKAVDGETIVGYDSDMRDRIFHEQMGIPYDLYVYPNYVMVLNATRYRECDVGWAPFFITASRLGCLEAVDVSSSNSSASPFHDRCHSGCCIDFSHTYFQETAGMLYRNDAFFMTKKSRFPLAMMFTPTIGNAMLFLFHLVIISAHVVWFVESRGGNTLWKREYLKGIDNAIEWSIGSTVNFGYGALPPITPVGRLYSALHTVAGVGLFAFVAGEITSNLVQRASHLDR